MDAAGNANGNANTLAGLADPNDTQSQIDGQDFVSFYAGIAAGAGRRTPPPRTIRGSAAGVTQAQAQRDQISGVSLDGHAAELMQFQRSYEAVSNLLTIVNDMATSLIDIIPEQQ